MKGTSISSHLRRKFAILVVLGLIAAGGIIFFRSERPMLDYLDEYKVLHSLRDQNTGKVIELGILSNFGSTEYEVGVYDAVNSERTSFDLRQQNISIVGNPGPNPPLVQFDGACYFIASAFREEWDRVHPLWKDDISGREICFDVVAPNGKKIGR
jgi:hypothetical protein